jgi:hypothetical protein
VEVRQGLPAEEAQVEARLGPEARREDDAPVCRLGFRTGTEDDVERSFGAAVPGLSFASCRRPVAAGRSVLGSTPLGKWGRRVDKWGLVV